MAPPPPPLSSSSHMNNNSNSINSNGNGPTSKALTPAAHHHHPAMMMREVTEDTPADLLLGTMDLVVVLPTKTSVRMTVNRRTPMMDLLIQVTTANKINPGGHIVLVRNERGIELRYKPSTPIGALDTTKIEIVPKNQVNEYMIVKKPPINKPANQPFEQTFRLQVHLPRQQLYVMRVGYKTVLQDILDEVCQEKNLDISKYEIRHPNNLDEKLLPSNTLGDYGLQQVTVVSKNSKSTMTHSTMSTSDIMAIQHQQQQQQQQQQHHHHQNESGTKTYLDSPFKYSRSSVGESSASSESAGSGCGVSRSDDDSRSVSPLPPPVPRAKVKLNTTVSNASSCSSEASSTTTAAAATTTAAGALKSAQLTSSRMDGSKPKKRAPAPPGGSTLETSRSVSIEETMKKGDPPPSRVLTKHESLPPQNHSRHSSDSSGYHDSSPSILSDNLDQRRNQRPLSSQQVPTNFGSSPLNKSSATSLTNLTSVSSLSSTSLASSNGGMRNKRKAPKPPPGTPGGFTLQAQTELEEEFTTDSDVGAGAAASTSVSSPSPSKVESKTNTNVNKVAADESSPLRRPQDVKNINIPNETDDFVVHTRKPVQQRSSSSMSSLSSPTSPPHSTASSPLPIDSKQSSSTANLKSKADGGGGGSGSGSVPMQEAALVAAELDNARATSRNSQAASSPTSTSLPKPPPRTARTVKSRDSSNPQPQQTAATATAAAVGPPQPKPRPRPDRKSNEFGLDDINSHESDSVAAATEAAAAAAVLKKSDSLNAEGGAGAAETKTAAQNANPLTRFGVKVLPNNALQERAARFPAMNERTSSTDADAGADNNRKYIRKLSPPSSQPATTTTNTSHNNLPLKQKRLKYESQESSHSTDDDSDNLEENLELFEVKRQESSHTNRNETKEKNSAHKISATSAASAVFGRRTISTSSKNSSSDNDNDNLASKSGGMGGLGGDERLNRWKNIESLDKETIEDVKPKAPKRINASTKSKQRARQQQQLSSDNEDSEELLDEGNDQVSSSESEISYSADSGITTTANPTPTPVSLEHVGQNDQVQDGNQSTATSINSPTTEAVSANWSEILQSKARNQDANMEKALHTANFKLDDDDEAENETNIQEMERNFELIQQQVGDKSESSMRTEFVEQRKDNDEKSECGEEVIIKDVHMKKKESGRQKLPKSESSSNSTTSMTASSTTQDPKSKRKTFADSTKVSAKHYQPSTNLKSRQHLSSSEEDLRKPGESSTSTRYISMQNLSSGESDNSQNVEKALQPISTKNPTIENQKATTTSTSTTTAAATASVIGTTDLEPEITQDPNLMQTFRVELEAQFEQWKEQFLQKHAMSKSGSKEEEEEDSTIATTNVPSIEEQQQQQQERTPDRVSPISASVQESEKHPDVEIPQPEKLRVEPSFESVQASPLPKVEEETKRTGEERPKPKVETLRKEPDSDQEAKILEKPTSEMQASSNTTNGEAVQNGRETQFYKYSGPPAIQMATWGERPRANISVKNDSDYKMGMGQNDAKSNEFRPKLGSVASRMHSFNGGPVASPMLLKSSSVSTTRSSPVPSVVANWQQSLQSSEEERKSTTPDKPSIVDEMKSESPSPSPFEDDKTLRKSASVTSTLERPGKLKANFSISSASSTLERPAKKLNAPVVYGIQNQSQQQQLNGKETTSAAVVNGNGLHTKTMGNSTWISVNDKSENSIIIESKASKEQTNSNVEKKPPANNANVTTVILNNNTSTSSLSNNDSNNHVSSLRDKKAFFQGVSPVESPSKEVPTPPSVNLKSSIATISKVFEQNRSKQQSQESSKVEQTIKPKELPPPSSSSSSPSLSSASSSFSSRSSSSPTPEYIGGPSQSTLMVQKVLKGNSFNSAFNRTSSSASASTSTASSRSSPRSTPSPTVIDTSSNKVYNSSSISTSTSAASSRDPSYYDNKAVIIIGGEDNAKKEMQSLYKQKLNIVLAPKEGVGAAPANAAAAKQNVAKVNVNGQSAPAATAAPYNTQVINITQTTTAVTDNDKSPFGVTLRNKKNQVGNQKSFEISEGELNKRNIGPMKLAGQTPTPPAPPPPPVMPLAEKPTTLAINGDNKKSNLSVSSPSSPDPRADIFNEIRKSGGNFKLKKTGSAAILR